MVSGTQDHPSASKAAISLSCQVMPRTGTGGAQPGSGGSRTRRTFRSVRPAVRPFSQEQSMSTGQPGTTPPVTDPAPSGATPSTSPGYAAPSPVPAYAPGGPPPGGSAYATAAPGSAFVSGTTLLEGPPAPWTPPAPRAAGDPGRVTFKRTLITAVLATAVVSSAL